MMTGLWWQEVRRSLHLPLILPVVLVAVLVLALRLARVSLRMNGPDALLSQGALPPAHLFSYGVEISLAVTAIPTAMVASGDLSDRSRGLYASYPVKTIRLAAHRVLTMVVLSVLTAFLLLSLGDLTAVPLPFLRDVVVLAPEPLFVASAVWAVTEWAGDPTFGAAAAGLIIVLGSGIQGFPFPHPVRGNLELFDAHNHLMSPALWVNRELLLGLAVSLFAVGATGVAFHRKRGTYAESN